MMVEEITKQGKNQISIDSYLMKNKNEIYLTGEINSEKAIEVIKQIKYLDNKCNDDIIIIIDSPGGDVIAGLAIYDIMQSCHNDVITIGLGMASSMGAVLLCAGTYGKRYAYKHTEIMIHNVSSAFQGNISDINISYARMKCLNDELLKILAFHSHNDVSLISEYTQRDNYLKADEAKKLGLIDDVL